MTADFSGIWRLVLARSVMTRAPAAMFVRIEHREPAFTQTILSIAADGARSTAVFTGTTTGTPFANTVNGTEMSGRASWRGEELLIETDFTVGERIFRFRDFWSLAGHGTLRMEHRDDDLAGQVAVLERAPEPPPEWAAPPR